MSWRNEEPKPVGCYVRNVHPCNADRLPDGVVTAVDEELGQLSVQIGRGSSVYGPAENWKPIGGPPSWLLQLRRERLEELRRLVREECISYGELAELQGLAEFIEAGDVELLEAAGVPEFSS